jgi:hypothetical protein
MNYVFYVQYTFFSEVWFSVRGHMVAQLVEMLCYKPNGRRYDSQWCGWNFLHPSSCSMALGLTQPLTEMSTRNISWAGV